jgi:cold shock CspA family protein
MRPEAAINAGFYFRHAQIRREDRMIGRIKNLSATSRSGFIQAENGQTVYFAGSAVWEHDFPFLTVGQAVSFELQTGHWPKAANVHLFEDHHLAHAPEKPPATIQLRYVGFDQVNHVRTFRFHGIVAGEQTKDLEVTTDVRLFQKHHVGIQEGPSLCTRILLAQLALSSEQKARPVHAVLSEQDLVSLVASRTVAARKPFRRRRPRPVRPQFQRPANPA